MTTLKNRPNTALPVVDVQNGVLEGTALCKASRGVRSTCRRANCCLWTADKAEAVFVDAARAVPGS
jgi:hypothetical protein